MILKIFPGFCAKIQRDQNMVTQLKVDHGGFEKEKLVIANVYFFGWWCTMSFPSTQLVEISFFWIDNDMWRKLCYFFHVRWQHNIDLRTSLPILSPASNQATIVNDIKFALIMLKFGDFPVTNSVQQSVAELSTQIAF